MDLLNTKIVKIGTNEYRVDDEFTLNFDDGSKLEINYGKSFEESKNDKLVWHKIIINEFNHFGIGPITVWNRNNSFDFRYGWDRENPLKNFTNAHGRYAQESENEYVNLILNLHKLNIIDNNIITKMMIWGSRDSVGVREMKYHLKEYNAHLCLLYTYGFNNKIVGHVNPNFIPKDYTNF